MRGACVGAVLFLALMSASSIALPVREPTSDKPWFCHDLDCPQFEVLETNSSKGVKYELRKYPAARWVYTMVQFDTEDDFKKAQGTAFMRLFQYISGANEAKAKIAMTAPVVDTIVPGQGPLCKNNLTLSFFVPFDFQRIGPPKPTDPEVFLTEWTEMQVYVSSFSTLPPGPSGKTLAEEAQKLADALPTGSFEASPFLSAQYDSPFRVFRRHDEIWLKKLPAAGNVKVEFLHEALCPYCILQDWKYHAAKVALASIADMRIIWWGNAKDTAAGIQCQHGPTECVGNRYFNCLQFHYPDSREEFTNCFDWSVLYEYGLRTPLSLDNFTAIAKNCSEVHKLDHLLLNTCATGDEGLKLVKSAEQETVPFGHKYVPWVAVDGAHSESAEKSVTDFVHTVCAAYKGPKPLPDICLSKALLGAPGSLRARAPHCAAEQPHP